MAEVTKTDPSKWLAWSKTGVVCKETHGGSLANPTAQVTSDTLSTKELYPTLLEMNKSIKFLHDEVKFLRAEAVLKSKVDESLYKTPTALISEHEVAVESLDDTLTLTTCKEPTTLEQRGRPEADHQ